MQSLRQEDVQAVKANTRLPVMPYNNATPRILIGLDHAHLGVPFRTKSYGSGGPFAADTALGWVVYGPVNGKPSSPLLNSCLLAVPQDDLLEKMVSDYFETENFGAKPVQPAAAGRVDLEPSVGDSGDARALSTLEKTTKRVGQRYETGLLWKDDEVRLPESYSMALRRLVNIERKMKRDVDFASAYIRIMDDYVKKGRQTIWRRVRDGEDTEAEYGSRWCIASSECCAIPWKKSRRGTMWSPTMEYLPTLVRREKWCQGTEPIRQGDMVFVCDPALPRREWRKGIVE
ncbi:hypothetical protein KR026_001701 [Drosophila bipectinata]|nr:hypothetical protein KR026_001701 [Drosophila bipectinata]